MRTLGNAVTSRIDRHAVLPDPTAPGPRVATGPMPVADVDDAEISPSGEPAESLTEPVSDGLVERIVADARATHVEPHPFIGLAERADVIIDLEIDNARYILLRTAPQQQAPPALSPRELEIARMVTKGLPNKSIATVLQISTWTVSSHLRRVFTKLGVNSRAEMVGRLLEAGCLPASSMFDLDGTLP